MNIETMLNEVNEDIYHSFKRAIELGKWANGALLTPEQRETCLQAIIAYEHKHNFPEELRVGYIDRGSKAGSQCDKPEEQPLNWRE